MKKILFLISLFVSVYAFGQDSSKVIYNEIRGNIWMLKHNVPAWQIDGYNFAIRNGDTLARVKGDGTYAAGDLQIYADGTDQSTKLNAVAGLASVKAIKISSDSSRAFVIDSAVNLKGKTVVFENGSYLTGTGTVDSLVVQSSMYDKIADTSITFTNLRSAINVITPQMFGAKGDDNNDDTKAIQKAFDVANTTVLFPTGVYKTTDSLVLNYTSKLNMPSGSLIKSYTTSVPAVIIGYPHGTPPSTVRNMSYSVRVQRATQSDWTNRNSIGVLLRNLNYCKIDHIEASNFTVGAKALAKNGGFSYVDYQLGLFLNNEIGLWIDEETSGPTAWNNQNNYYGGWFRANSSINVSKQRWGVVIGHEGGYRHTNNVFLGTDFELINAAAVPVLVNAGSRNVFRDYRSEGNSDTSAKVISGNGNMFYPAKCSESDTLVDLSSFASNMLECLEKTPRNKINYSPIISVDNLTNYTQYSGNDTSINIRGNLSFISREAKLVVIKTRKGITRTDNGLSFGADFPGGITTDIFNTSSLKKYMLRYSATGGAATLLIKSYNEDGVLLRDGLHVANTYTSTPTYTSTYGGAWIIGNVVPGEILLTAEDTVKSMQIIVGMGNSSSTIGIQSFKLFTYGEGTTDAGFFRQSPTDFLNTSPTAPVYGSYHRGEIILNDNPKKDSVWAWVCTSSGTFGNLSGVTGSGSNTSIKLVLSDASSVNVKEWLLVNNKPNIVTGKWGDTVYLSNPLTSTISGVSINYATPTFEPIAYVGATGGSMPGWVLDTLTAHNNRLSNVEQNDTINVTFEKNAGKDSIVLTIEGKRMAVEDASGVGGGSGGSVDFITPSELDTLFAQNNIAAWGNSLTAGYPAYPYPERLSQLTGRYVYNGGVSGQISTQIRDRMIADKEKFNWPTIIWAGNNNATDTVNVLSQIKQMVDSLKHDRYLIMQLVIGDYPNRYAGQPERAIINRLNDTLAERYGSHFVPINDYLLSLNTGTGDDVNDATHQVVPSSLRVDAIHLNKAGYDTIARYIYNNYINILTYGNSKAVTANDMVAISRGNISGQFKNSLRVVNSRDNEAFSVDAEQKVTTITGKTDYAIANGSDLITNGTFASGLTGWTATGWTDGSGKATHTTGNTNTLSQTITPCVGCMYEVSITVSGSTAGGITVSIGAVDISNNKKALTYDRYDGNGTLVSTFHGDDAYGNQTFKITPTSNFDGSVSNIKVVRVSQNESLAMNVSGQRISVLGSNIGIGGVNPLQFLYTGNTGNIGISNKSFSNLTYGTSNTAIGSLSLEKITTGDYNSAVGFSALQLLRGGYYNSAQGSGALQKLYRGNNNSAFGASALGYAAGFSVGNSAVGYNAGLGTLNMVIHYNTLLGTYAGNNINNGAEGNFIGGAYTGQNVGSGKKNIIIGYYADLPVTGGSNQLNIANAIFGVGVNQAYGNMAGNIGIKVKSPTEAFHVGGKVRIDTIPTGTAGTDSVLVVNNGVVKMIPANYYSTGEKTYVAYIDDANYTFADTISSMVLNNASADRTVNLPSASSYVGREITVRNTTKYKITFNAAVTYDKTKGSANLYPGTWVRMVARDAGWTAVEQGSSGLYSYTPTLTDSTDQINSSTIGVFNWTALEDRVHVTGRVSVSPKSSDSDVMATFYLTLPAPTTMTNQNDIGGSGSYWAVDYSNGFANVSLGGTNTAQVRFVKEPSNGRAYYINVDFWYKIK